MRDTHTDHVFRELVDKRILALRNEFFEFMWDYTSDLADLETGQDDPGLRVLMDYFCSWTSSHLGGRQIVPDEMGSWQVVPNKSEIFPDEGTLERDSREFEEYNQLLPLVLLTVVDAVWKNPEVLDANPRNHDGSRRAAYHRRVDYLLTSPPDSENPNDLKDPNLEEAIDQLSQGDWPSITSLFDD